MTSVFESLQPSPSSDAAAAAAAPSSSSTWTMRQAGSSPTAAVSPPGDDDGVLPPSGPGTANESRGGMNNRGHNNNNNPRRANNGTNGSRTTTTTSSSSSKVRGGIFSSIQTAVSVQVQARKRLLVLLLLGFAIAWTLISIVRTLTTPSFTFTKHDEYRCWKGSELRTKVEHVEEGELRTRYNISELVEGPGLDPQNLEHDDRLACKFVDDDARWRRRHNMEGPDAPPAHYFKHPTQQLYRCFAWWRTDPSKSPYLIVSRTTLLSFDEYTRVLIDLFRDVWGVRVVHFRDTLKAVRPATLIDFERWRNNKQAYAMRSVDDAVELRRGVLRHYGINHTDADAAACRQDRKPVVGILDRERSRSLHNAGAIVRAIEAAVGAGELDFRVATFDHRSFEEQVELIHDVDLLITPHGAHLKALPFMASPSAPSSASAPTTAPRSCKHMLELLPAGHYLPYLFGSLAAVSHIQHSYMYLGHDAEVGRRDRPGSDRKKLKQTQHAFDHWELKESIGAVNLCPNPDLIAVAVVDMIEGWYQCCQQQQRGNSKSNINNINKNHHHHQSLPQLHQQQQQQQQQEQ